ncbi:YihY/virulence factor BrkB family protein [Amycolatopsis roodepoortensis]|uniref:YihY/virulence factor BrkB family protein n=1 Tax=Amycolatopsis roodepoortensis TaxID=700274 RepID=UPI00214B8F3E|nr:YihY/virulence factor BrkB family protein [Amycolatopsis roodepoortensis]UUV31887.1 YihY/virulence factor BrkB family protein [Amycolatopsis roodepoortensis]
MAATAKDPDGPTELSRRSWWAVLKRTFVQFNRDNMLDWAAALTYYGVLSLFPGLLVLTAILGLMGPSATQALVENVGRIAPGQGRDILIGAIEELSKTGGLAGTAAIIGSAGALWSASGYIGAFMRASNVIYSMPEGRPIWKTVPLRIGLTIAVLIVLALCAAGVVATGGIARHLGDLIGLGSTGVLVWDIVKWPVIALLAGLAFAMLYWVSPNVRQPKFRWLTPGGLVAVLLWAAATAGFAFYVSNFGSYNKVYGSLAGVIVFLIWLWISNIAVLLGAELDAELARGKEQASGYLADDEPFLPPRDTAAMDDDEAAAVAEAETKNAD